MIDLLKELFPHHIMREGSGSTYFHIPCPECGERAGRSGVIHAESASYRCWQDACQWSGAWRAFGRLAEARLGFSPEEAKQLFKASERAVQLRNAPQSKSSIRLPGHFIPISEAGEGKLSKDAVKYLVDRGISLEFADSMGVGYVKSASSRYYGRIIIPHVDESGNLLYYQARDFTGLSRDRWLNPEEGDGSAGKSLLVYNSAVLYEAGRVEIFEGVFDSWTVMPSVHLYGKDPSETQVHTLLASPCREFIVGFDDGAFLSALKLAQRLMGGGRRVWVRDVRGGDANSLGADLYLKCPLVLVDSSNALPLMAAVAVRAGKTYYAPIEAQNLW